MEEEPESFVRRGTQQKPIETAASKVEDAIREGRDIDIQYAVIKEELQIAGARANISILDTRIDGEFYFIQHGTEKQRIKIQASNVEDAIRKGQDINIRYAVIKGELQIAGVGMDIAVNMSVLDTEIDGNIQSYGVTFSGTESFRRSTFNGTAMFDDSTFKHTADFEECVFRHFVSFQRVSFTGGSDFSNVRFESGSYFTDAKFCRHAAFGSAEFDGDADFSKAAFLRGVDYTSVTFGMSTDFNRAKFTVGACFAKVTMSRPATFAGVDFLENNVYRGLWNNVICPMCWLLIRSVFLILMLWEKAVKREQRKKERQEKERRKRNTFIQVLSQLSMFVCKIWERVSAWRLPSKPVTDFYSINTSTVMDGSSNPYLKRYIDDEQWVKSWRERGGWRKALFIVWELTSHCGRSFALWMFWSALIATAFAGIYQILGNGHITFVAAKLLEKWPDFLSYLYYSVVTFTTLGFGDIIPLTNPGRFVVGAEVLLGYIMLGGLISIFANSFARRS